MKRSTVDLEFIPLARCSRLHHVSPETFSICRRPRIIYVLLEKDLLLVELKVISLEFLLTAV